MLKPKEIFKVAFLKAAAERGLTLEETHECVKVAEGILDWIPGGSIASNIINQTYNKGLDVAGDVSKFGLKGLLGTALIAPPAIGYGAGRLAGAMTDVSDEDAAEGKKRQLIAEYQRLAKDIQNRKKVPLVR